MSILNHLKAGRKLFVPNRHLWIRPTAATSMSITNPCSSSLREEGPSNQNGGNNKTSSQSSLSSSPSLLAVIDIGLTYRGMEDIGDISGIVVITNNSNGDTDTDNDDNMSSAHKNNRFVSASEHVMKIEWDGHVHSEADELYHTVWETFTEVTLIQSPISGTLKNILGTDEPYVDDETTLFTIETDIHTLELEMGNVIVTEDVYRKKVLRQPRGIFYDENDLNVNSRGVAI